MTQLVHRCRPLLEALETVDRARLLERVVDLEIWELRVPDIHLFLAVYQVKREAVNGIIKGHGFAAARSVREIIDFRGLAFLGECLGGVHQILLGLDGKGGAAKLILVGLIDAQDEGLGAVTAVIGLFAYTLGLVEAKVLHELTGLGDILVFVGDVGDVGKVYPL